MSYEKVCDSDKVKVLKHFIRVESTKKKYAERREELVDWINLLDIEFLNKVRDFEKQRCDENPIFVWTIGTGKNPNRHRKVKRWIWQKST